MNVYMDYAATTPVDPRVFKEMKPYFNEKFGNTMSLHKEGREAKETLEQSRKTVAKLMNAKPKELVFTGSATEANNTVIKGIAHANKNKGKHIVISNIEHYCVLEPVKWLENQGYEITRIPVNQYGIVNVTDLEKCIRKDTILVSIMHANNEIGTIQDVYEIGKICTEKNVYFHSDAAQSFGKIPIDVKTMSMDLLSVSSHKMYGPKGVGALYIKEGTKIDPLLHGGGHEFNMRSSTINVAGIVGFAKATKIQQEEMSLDAQKQIKLRNKLIKKILEIDNSYLNGHPINRLPNNSNFWFDYIEGESLLLHLDMNGISASTGSACSSNELEASHVLLAIGLKPQQAHGSLRLSIGKYTKEKEVDYVIEKIPEAVKKLREISPLLTKK
jgi:cysteine desulfurase